ncbi:MAG: transporter substrate-binding domain-containing protein [Synergistaceae bacterium]|nr:transporter substrate-binding domain-containing protein [Synergistaceae bacterium]
MRRFFLSLLMFAIVAWVIPAYSAPMKVGILSKLNMTQEEYSEFIAAGRKAGAWGLFSSKPVHDEPVEFAFYDSLQALQLALNAGEIGEIFLPKAVAEYVMNIAEGYKVSAIARTRPAYFSFGFREDDDPSMREKFNNAINSMKGDGTLAILQARYIAEPGVGEPDSVEFKKFPNVDTKIIVGVTGDLPPVDYVSPNGKAAGFNTAVLAEIGRRLEINIELLDIDAGARASALASGRADAVSWIQGHKNVDKDSDIPEGIELSEPYYEWNEFLFLSR